EQGAVFADHVHQVRDNFGGVLVVVALGVAPGIFGDGGVVLPEIRRNIRKLAALDVPGSGAVGKGVVFVVDGDFLAPFGGAVIIVGRELPQVGFHGFHLNPPVEIQNLRAVF